MRYRLLNRIIKKPLRLLTTQSFVTDFQGSPGIKIFNRYVKLGDSLALCMLLLRVASIQQKIRCNDNLIVHDVGGADGTMMLTLLRILHLRAIVSVNEPNQERLNEYKERQMQFPHHFASIETFNKKIEDKTFEIPSSRELILASHILYYNRELWLTCASLKEHLFTKLFLSLCINGALCVVLQHSPMFKKGSHELWEDFTYPLLKSIKHGQNESYASSQLFDAALSAYRKQFMFETGSAIDWTVQEKIVDIRVPLGKINTVPDASGKYLQTEDVLEILNFYLKGNSFNDLSSDLQKRTIDFLSSHFKRENQYEMVHYNKVYCIKMGPTLFSRLRYSNNEKTVNPLQPKI